MGGEGSIMAMRASLRNNNKQLHKKNYFKSNKKNFTTKDNHKLTYSASLSAKERTAFRAQLKKERRAEDIQIIIIFIILVVVLAVTFVLLFY